MRHRAPGYYQMIKDPQDLGTIRARLEADKYKQPADVSTDATFIMLRHGRGARRAAGRQWWAGLVLPESVGVLHKPCTLDAWHGHGGGWPVGGSGGRSGHHADSVLP